MLYKLFSDEELITKKSYFWRISGLQKVRGSINWELHSVLTVRLLFFVLIVGRKKRGNISRQKGVGLPCSCSLPEPIWILPNRLSQLGSSACSGSFDRCSQSVSQTLSDRWCWPQRCWAGPQGRMVHLRRGNILSLAELRFWCLLFSLHFSPTSLLLHRLQQVSTLFTDALLYGALGRAKSAQHGHGEASLPPPHLPITEKQTSCHREQRPVSQAERFGGHVPHSCDLPEFPK